MVTWEFVNIFFNDEKKKEDSCSLNSRALQRDVLEYVLGCLLCYFTSLGTSFKIRTKRQTSVFYVLLFKNSRKTEKHRLIKFSLFLSTAVVDRSTTVCLTVCCSKFKTSKQQNLKQ